MSTPTLAVWKFASCDGCQLTLLDCEDELLTIAEEVQIATFLEASSDIVGGPYDVSLVERSITTAADERRIKEIREQSKVLVTIGACATAGGVQALRNFADIDEFTSVVYAKPEYIDTLATSTPASAHVKVDYQLPGCPIDRGQLLDTLGSGRAQAAVTGQDRMYRMQAARGDLCRGGRGHPVSRPGNTCRMWGVVPVVSPWLLRLFRSCRNAQPPLLSRCCGATGCQMTTWTACSRRSTSPVSPPNGTTVNPEIRTLSVGALTRVEGEVRYMSR